MNRRNIAQSYVLAPDGSEYTLKYYLATGQTAADAPKYGVMIEEYFTDQCSSETRLFSADEEAALKVIDLLARGFVFPGTVDDVLEELAPVLA